MNNTTMTTETMWNITTVAPVVAGFTDIELMLISSFDITRYFLYISSIPYTWLVLVLIINHKELKSSYYDLVLATAPADFLTMVTSAAPLMLEDYPIYRSLYECVRSWTISVEAYGLIAMAANRYMAVLKPLHYKLWTRKHSIIIITVEYSVAFVISFFRLLPCCRVKNQINMEMEDVTLTGKIFTFQLIHNCLIVLPIVTILYGIMCSRIGEVMKTSDRVALRLLFVAFITTMPLVFFNVTYLLRVVTNLTYPIPAVFFMHGTQLLASVTPWLLFFLSTEVRNAGLALLKCKKLNSKMTAKVHSIHRLKD